MTRAALAYIRWRSRNSNLVRHARAEMGGALDGGDQVCSGVLDLLSVLATQGHSGSSAPYTIGMFDTLARFKPWGMLMGDDDEWAEPHDPKGTQQNLRMSSVFRGADGRAYWIEGRVFIDEHGGHCTRGLESRVYITFPWMPVDPEYVHDLPDPP